MVATVSGGEGGISGYQAPSRYTTAISGGYLPRRYRLYFGTNYSPEMRIPSHKCLRDDSALTNVPCVALVGIRVTETDRWLVASDQTTCTHL